GDRVGLRLAGPGPAAAGIRPAPRLSRRAGGHYAVGHGVHRAQPGRRPALRLRRSADPAGSGEPVSATSVFPAALRGAGANASAWARVRRVARRNPQIVVGSIIVLAFVVIGSFAPLLAPYPYDDQDLSNQLRPPIWAGGPQAHPLGTDEFGRDTLSRLIYGARISLVVGLFSVVLA